VGQVDSARAGTKIDIEQNHVGIEFIDYLACRRGGICGPNLETCTFQLVHEQVLHQWFVFDDNEASAGAIHA
jgi:hypothetical protein